MIVTVGLAKPWSCQYQRITVSSPNKSVIAADLMKPWCCRMVTVSYPNKSVITADPMKPWCCRMVTVSSPNKSVIATDPMKPWCCQMVTVSSPNKSVIAADLMKPWCCRMVTVSYPSDSDHHHSYIYKPLSHPSSCMLVNHGPSQQSSKEEYKPWKCSRCYCKILRTSYEDHVTNQEVCAKIQQAIGSHKDLLMIVKRCKMQWYGHVSRSSGLAKTILQGTVKGGRRQGRQRKRLEDNIKE